VRHSIDADVEMIEGEFDLDALARRKLRADNKLVARKLLAVRQGPAECPRRGG
jgi:hypothetical protein